MRFFVVFPFYGRFEDTHGRNLETKQSTVSPVTQTVLEMSEEKINEVEKGVSGEDRSR